MLPFFFSFFKKLGIYASKYADTGTFKMLSHANKHTL